MKMTIKIFAACFVLAGLSGCSTTSGGGNSGGTSDLQKRIAAHRIAELKRQAPLVGIPVDRALKTQLMAVYICPESGNNKDGSFVCGDCPGTGSDCVHAWFRGAPNNPRAEYMFASPNVLDGTINHEVHHELMVIHYGIGGHPKKSTVTRIDNGQKLTINHGSVIGWRWPSLVNWALPASLEIGTSWGDLKCGTEERFEDGGGI